MTAADQVETLCETFHTAYQRAAGLKPSPWQAMPARDRDNTRAAVLALLGELVPRLARELRLGPPEAVTADERLDVAISATADGLLAVCALQTGTDPMAAYHRAHRSLLAVMDQAADEARNRG